MRSRKQAALTADEAPPHRVKEALLKMGSQGASRSGVVLRASSIFVPASRARPVGRVIRLPFRFLCATAMSNRMNHPIETRERFPWLFEVATRWADNDVYGHVNNAAYYSFFDTAGNRFLIDHGVRCVTRHRTHRA